MRVLHAASMHGQQIMDVASPLLHTELSMTKMSAQLHDGCRALGLRVRKLPCANGQQAWAPSFQAQQ